MPRQQSYSNYDNFNINKNAINNTIEVNSMKKSPTEIWDKTKGPDGVRFDEMETHRRGEQNQYKNDLEYLINLKNQRHGDMTQKEWEAYNRKLHYMNDRYAYGELDKINFLRGMMKGYESEAILKKENKRRNKELEDEEDRKKLKDVDALERIEREKEREKKQKLFNEQLDDLNNFQKKKIGK